MCSSIQLQFFASQKTPASEGGRYKVCTFRSEGAARKNRCGDKSRREPKTHTKIRRVGHPGQERRKPQRASNRSGIKPLLQNRRRHDSFRENREMTQRSLRYWFYGSAAVSTSGLCGRRIISFSDAPAGTIG